MSEPIVPCPQCNKDGFIAIRRPSGVLRYIECDKCRGDGVVVVVEPQRRAPSWLLEWLARDDWRARK